MYAYQIHDDSTLGAVVEVAQGQPAPAGFTFRQPPAHTDDDVLLWLGNGWEVVTSPECKATLLQQRKERLLMAAQHTHKARIKAAAEEALAALTASYPDREVLTFERQEREARALLRGDTTDVMHISGIAQGRGIPVEELARKIVAKADAYSLAAGSLIGQRQALEDAVDAANSVEEVLAIKVMIALPDSAAGDDEAAKTE